MRKLLLLVVALPLFQGLAEASEVDIGVLGLFHPQKIIVTPASPEGVNCSGGGQKWPLRTPTRVTLRNGVLLLAIDGEVKRADQISCSSGHGPAHFSLSVPGKITRAYVGTLIINAQASELQLVVRMDLETAVASVTAAESLPNTPLDALKAQAVAARSFLSAGKGRHATFDFCDTTHCQFLRQPPAPGSAASLAAQETKGLVLAYENSVFAAMYSSSCGGKTHTLQELGISVHDYPYYSVVCDYCHRHPHAWTSTISNRNAEALKNGENGRLRLARQLGWKTVLSNSYTERAAQGGVVLEGVGVGHGLGLCQRGAADMARHGASWSQILQHYYPNTTLRSLNER